MKKAILSPAYGAQEIPELETLKQIQDAGTYAVKGYYKPVNAQPVTAYGAERIREQYPEAIFFSNEDGISFFALKTGRFAD